VSVFVSHEMKQETGLHRPHYKDKHSMHGSTYLQRGVVAGLAQLEKGSLVPEAADAEPAAGVALLLARTA
jgi:hypothetical protein